MAEYVVPLVRADAEDMLPDSSEANVIQGPMNISKPDVFFPGSEWLYVKLYGMSEREDEFIANYLRAFCEFAEKQSYFHCFFVVRYRDPQPHIRVRFHGEATVLHTHLVPAIRMWASQLQQEGILNRVLFDTYIPETDRYGGAALIHQTEQIFAEDSRLSIQVLYLKYGKKYSHTVEDIAFISVVDMINQWIPSLEEQVKWTRQKEWHRDYAKDFQKQRSKYMALCDTSNGWITLRSLEFGELLLKMFEARNAKLRQFRDLYIAENHETGGAVSLFNILDSFIHMHLNRVLGVDRSKEARLMAFIGQSIYHLYESKKHKSKSETIVKELLIHADK